MSSFRTSHTVKRKEPGSRGAGGVWVDGDEKDITIKASVQPATSSDYDLMQATAGGRRLEAMIRIYTDTELVPAGKDNTNGDVLVWRGNRYLVIGIAPWQSTRLRHFRCFAVKELES